MVAVLQVSGEVQMSKAVLGGGCFWCIEAVFEKVDGVVSAVSGYAGGHLEDPTYKEVSSGRSGHIEVVEILFDPQLITYEEILKLFFKAHDPTSLNRQGADVGTQYRSAILYTSEDQRIKAEQAVQEASKNYEDPIVTEIEPLEKFYKAEDYHQDYFRNNPQAAYCRFVISPKLKKLGF